MFFLMVLSVVACKVEPLHNGHLGDRRKWPLEEVGCPGGGGAYCHIWAI